MNRAAAAGWRRGQRLLPAALLLAQAAACAPEPPDPIPLDAAAHRAEVEAWARRREAELRAPDSWLTLIGLHWLEEGETTMGSGPDADIPLPAGRAPALLGTLERSGPSVRFRAAPGVRVLQGVDSTISLPVATGAVPPDTAGDPAVSAADLTADVGAGRYVVLRHGALNWIVIHRGERVALRLRDNEAQARRNFEGVERYPTDPAWRLTARWVPHRKTVAVPNVLGTVTEQRSPAYLEFWIDGARHTLDVTGDPGDDRYMLVFADATSGRETYGGGRYVWIGRPDREGRVILDFNLAYNPPCVWTDYATCPLPTRDNRLDPAVRAGERDPGHGGAGR